MSKALLGDTFDIHGGGIDLQFPHHENEIAQSCCANGTNKMANIWLHNEMLQVEGRKMSKSLGNFFTVRDLLDRGVPGEVIRFVFLSTHYSKPMDWTEKKAQEAEKTLRKWRSLANSAGADGEINSDVLKAVCDDLNTPGAIAELHRLAKGIQVRHRDEVTQSEIDSFAASARFVGLLQDNAAMGSWVFDGAVEKLEQDVLLDSLANSLFEARRSAMESKDFSKVDAMKATLVEAGVEVRMSKAGVELVPGAGFDPSKLESL
jgi:cysteinyl-tRNA synthetase